MASIRERTTRAGETTWAVLYRHGGKQASKTFGDPESAEKFRTLVEILGPEKAAAEMLGSQRQGPTLDELAAQFFDWKATTSVTERTLADYRRDYENWISPMLGHRRAETIDERDVQALVDHMARRLDPKSVADRHAILHGIYKWASARSRRIVDHDPCQETDLPRKKRKPPKGVSLPEWHAIHGWASIHEPDAADLLFFMVATGWRWSEVAALTTAAVEDYVDHAGRTQMFVSVQRVFRRDAEGRRVVAEGEAKSRAGSRRINLSDAAAAVVRRRIVGKGPGDLVFTRPNGKPWHSGNFLNRTWPKILAGAEIDRQPRPTPHGLRHAHVALMDRAGVSLPKMQRRIGHESIQTTVNVYGGMIDNSLSEQELAALDAMLTPTTVAGEVVSGSVVRGELD